MSLDTKSKHYDAYYGHVLGEVKAAGTIAKVYEIIHDISDRRGLRQEWDDIDGEIQDEIIETWCKIIDNSN